VRGIPQREWDVKAWTLKMVEVCHVPTLFLSFLIRCCCTNKLLLYRLVNSPRKIYTFSVPRCVMQMARNTSSLLMKQRAGNWLLDFKD
jgi:hypothetical protein